jgi:hypothetical protein
MQELKFPISSTPGRVTGEGDGRLINAYAHKDGDQVYMRRSPGLITTAIVQDTTPRGLLSVDSDIYSAHNGAVYQNSTLLAGTISGTAGVTWAVNRAGNIVAVSESGGAFTIVAGNVVAYSTADSDIPSDVNSVTFGNGYFFFSTPGALIIASGLNAYTIDPLSFATAESREDGLHRVIWHSGVLYAFGPSTIEPWLDVGNIPFPLTKGTSTIQCGLLTPMAVAGFEEGWDRPIHFVAHDGTVRALTGYTTKVVSTPAVEWFIRNSTTASLVAFVYTVSGNAMWVLRSAEGTWEYNTTTGLWNERQSASGTGWRAKYSTKHLGNWYLGDTISSPLLIVNDTTYAEASADLTFWVESAPLKGFPAGIVIPAVLLDFTDAEANALISWSKDGGATWSTPLTRSIANAQKWPVRVNRLGLSSQHGLRLRVLVSTAVAFSFMGASVAGPEVRKARPDEAKAA